MYLWRSLVNNCGMCARGGRHHSWNNWECCMIIEGLSKACLNKNNKKSHFSNSSVISSIWFTTSHTPSLLLRRSQTYSLVLLGGPERGLAMDGYLLTCFFRGQEAANMAPPRTSRREPPQAMKMAAPNSNLGQTRCWQIISKWQVWIFSKNRTFRSST